MIILFVFIVTRDTDQVVFQFKTNYSMCLCVCLRVAGKSDTAELSPLSARSYRSCKVKVTCDTPRKWWTDMRDEKGWQHFFDLPGQLKYEKSWSIYEMYYESLPCPPPFKHTHQRERERENFDISDSIDINLSSLLMEWYIYSAYMKSVNYC